jgi:hypothetical protein
MPWKIVKIKGRLYIKGNLGFLRPAKGYPNTKDGRIMAERYLLRVQTNNDRW